jgi:hypothetical protein
VHIHHVSREAMTQCTYLGSPRQHGCCLPANHIARCPQVDPTKRPKSSELLQHPCLRLAASTGCTHAHTSP